MPILSRRGKSLAKKTFAPWSSRNLPTPRVPARPQVRTFPPIADAPPGAILIWDSLYGMLNADATRKVQIKDILDRG